MFNSISVVAFLGLFYTGVVDASLVSPTGYIAGLDLRWGKSESNALQAYDEAQGVTVAGGKVRVDYLMGHNLLNGTTLSNSPHSSRGLTLGAGQYNSHLIHFDPLGINRGKVENVKISFKENIVAIIIGHKYLNWSDVLFGGSDTIYQKKKSRRLESHDLFTLEDSTTLVLNRLKVGRYWIDEARIITHSIPEPSSLALFGLGLMGIVGLSFRRVKQKNRP